MERNNNSIKWKIEQEAVNEKDQGDRRTKIERILYNAIHQK